MCMRQVAPCSARIPHDDEDFRTDRATQANPIVLKRLQTLLRLYHTRITLIHGLYPNLTLYKFPHQVFRKLLRIVGCPPRRLAWT